MSKTVKTVMLADDHVLVRNAVRQIVEDIDAVKIVAESADGISAIADMRLHKPNLLILDAAMPLARGIEVFSETRRWSKDTRVVLLTGFTSLALLTDWIEAGVDGLLLKTNGSEEMKRCFTEVLAGRQYISAEVSERLEDRSAATSLTNREREVLALIATGQSNASIAARLSLSPKTVEKHRGSLMAKAGVHSVSELMVFALREGYLDEHRQL